MFGLVFILPLLTSEELFVPPEDVDDAEDDTEHLSKNDRRKRKTRKIVPPKKPVTKMRKARQNQRKRASSRGEDSVRKDSVS